MLACLITMATSHRSLLGPTKYRPPSASRLTDPLVAVRNGSV